LLKNKQQKNMKKFLTIAVLGVLTTLSACKDKDEPGKEVVQLGKLSDTWQLTNVTQDDVVVAGYDDFSLTLSGSTAAATFTYATTGRPALSPWPVGGRWKFGTNVNEQLVRDAGTDDELVITYAVSATTLTLEFEFTGDGYENTRVNSPEGQWVFTFDKQ
jgi:hypothetical protein